YSALIQQSALIYYIIPNTGPMSTQIHDLQEFQACPVRRPRHCPPGPLPCTQAVVNVRFSAALSTGRFIADHLQPGTLQHSNVFAPSNSSSIAWSGFFVSSETMTMAMHESTNAGSSSYMANTPPSLDISMFQINTMLP